MIFNFIFFILFISVGHASGWYAFEDHDDKCWKLPKKDIYTSPHYFTRETSDIFHFDEDSHYLKEKTSPKKSTSLPSTVKNTLSLLPKTSNGVSSSPSQKILNLHRDLDKQETKGTGRKSSQKRKGLSLGSDYTSLCKSSYKKLRTEEIQLPKLSHKKLDKEKKREIILAAKSPEKKLVQHYAELTGINSSTISFIFLTARYINKTLTEEQKKEIKELLKNNCKANKIKAIFVTEENFKKTYISAYVSSLRKSIGAQSKKEKQYWENYWIWEK